MATSDERQRVERTIIEHTSGGRRQVVARDALTEDERRDVRALADLCNATDGTDLKLAYGGFSGAGVGGHSLFLAYENGALAGYCSLDGSYDVEVCGMVRPERRRQGIGRALLAAALDECRRRPVEKLLLICEDVSAAGRAFTAAVGGQFEFAELRMYLEALHARPAQGERIALRPAGTDDLDALARVAATAFDEPLETTRAHIAHELRDPTVTFYLGLLGERPVGQLKVYVPDDGVAGIYGFGVLSERRGQGIGRQILTQTIERLHADGITRIGLEVLTENANALGLYRSLGFREATTYGYYRLAV